MYERRDRTRDEFDTAIDSVDSITINLQRDIAMLQEMITAVSWFLLEQKLIIDKSRGECVTSEELSRINSVLCNYNRDLLQIDTAIRQAMFKVRTHFDFEDMELCKVYTRVVGDR